MAYENPAAAVGVCLRKGRKTPGDIYECAIGRMPRSASPTWAKVARRLAVKHGQLDGVSKRRRRKRRR